MQALAQLIRRSGVTHIQATPSLWRILLASSETKLDGLHVLVGGEPLSAELADRYLADLTNVASAGSKHRS